MGPFDTPDVQGQTTVDHIFALGQTPDEDIGIGHLPEELTAQGAAKDSSTQMRSARDLLDAQAIRTALERNNFDRLAAARELGIHKSTLFRKIKKLGIVLPEQDGRSRRAQGASQ